MELEHHVVRGDGFEREAWLLPAATSSAHRLCVVLDAEIYLERVECVPVLVDLMARGVIPPMTCALVSHGGAAARHFDFLCSTRHAEFVARDVVRWVRDRVPGVEGSGHLACGLSLSGLASAHLAFTRPDVFSAALCQSGSFWWLVQEEVSLPPTAARLWLSVGDEETDTGISHPPSGLRQRLSQIDGVAAAAERFARLGATVRRSTYSGGHDPTAWRAELEPALRWLLVPEAESERPRT